MKNLAPEIMRKRVLIEAKYTIPVSEQVVKDFLIQLPQALGLRIYGEPAVHTATGQGKVENSGYDALFLL